MHSVLYCGDERMGTYVEPFYSGRMASVVEKYETSNIALESCCRCFTGSRALNNYKNSELLIAA